MPNIATVLYNDIIKPRKRMILYVFLIVVFSAASYYAYVSIVKPRLAFTENFGTDVANDNTRQDQATLMGFFAEWCPFCKQATPIWNKYTKDMKNQSQGKYLLSAMTVDCSDGSDSRIQQYSVNGYPTVIIIKDGEVVRFEGKITAESLASFVNATLPPK